MIERPQPLGRIREAFRVHPVASLLGPRQCGKTTLARILAAEEPSTYFDLENPVDVQRLSAPMTALEGLGGLVVIDEIQRRPELFELLRVLVDRPDNPARFLLLGSASPKLVKGVSESLAGRVGFVDLSGFDLEGGRQELRGDTLIVTREDWGSMEPSFSLPYPRMDLRETLRPEPLIQSDDPTIREVAEAATNWRRRSARNPRRAAAELTRWVDGYVEKSVTFSVPSALQVLEGRQGDCNEHTVLFVAMARSLGLPARTAVGLVYLDGAFYYHAWPEVWLDEWVAVDPTFGQVPADAAHVSVERHPALGAGWS